MANNKCVSERHLSRLGSQAQNTKRTGQNTTDSSCPPANELARSGASCRSEWRRQLFGLAATGKRSLWPSAPSFARLTRSPTSWASDILWGVLFSLVDSIPAALSSSSSKQLKRALDSPLQLAAPGSPLTPDECASNELRAGAPCQLATGSSPAKANSRTPTLAR